MKIHTYVIATDAGSAPNYDRPRVTLAVCKPIIRRTANVGDLVMAFAGKAVNPYEPHAVVWAGVVSEKLSFSDYWNDQRFQRKKPGQCSHPDNFYRPTSDGCLLWVDNPVHDADAASHDLGGVYVLVFDPAWWFGANGPPLPEAFGLRMVGARRGQRVTTATVTTWEQLKAWLDQERSGLSNQDAGPDTGSRRCRTPATKGKQRRARSRC